MWLLFSCLVRCWLAGFGFVLCFEFCVCLVFVDLLVGLRLLFE